MPVELQIINAKLTPLSDDEVRAIVEIEMHPAVREWLVDYVFEDFDKEFEDYKRFFREVQGNDKVEVLVAKLGSKVVGFLTFWVTEERGERVGSVGVSVHPDHWGEGVATKLVKESMELARALNVKKLVIETVEENVAMRRVAEKLGFKLEYVREDKPFKNGSRHDEYVYSLRL
jgi:RimJ/RimL family protein N-acetyltransferase